MEFIVVIDAESVFGARILAAAGKIGGATSIAEISGKKHPAIVCRDLDWSLPTFLRAIHLQNPGAPQDIPRHIALPSASILFAMEVLPDAAEIVAMERPLGRLH